VRAKKASSQTACSTALLSAVGASGASTASEFSAAPKQTQSPAIDPSRGRQTLIVFPFFITQWSGWLICQIGSGCSQHTRQAGSEQLSCQTKAHLLATSQNWHRLSGGATKAVVSHLRK
jgi:hypothetical protein